MSLIISKIEKWLTSDGVEHTTKEMAEQHVINDEFVASLIRDDRTRDQAQDLVNEISGRRDILRRWLYACDAMEKASLR